MCQYNIACWLLNHLWAVVVIVILMLVILLLPYEVTRFSRAGNVYFRCRALLWSWEQGPNRTRIVVDGLLQLQRGLMKAIQWIWQQYRDRLWRGVREMLKQWMA